MSEKQQDLPSKLAKARQQLKKAQQRVADLEAQLFEGQPNSAALLASEDPYKQPLEILHQIDLGIINASSVQALVKTTLKHIRRIIPCQRADVMILDDTTGEALIFAIGFDSDTTLGQGVRVPAPPNVFEGYDARHIRVFDDFRPLQDTMPRARRLVNEGLLCALSALLMDRERPIGVLGLFADTPGFFTAEHQEIAAELANQLAIPIHQMQLSEALEQHAAELEQNNADLRQAEAALKRYAQRMEILHQIDTGIINATSNLEVIEVALKNIRQLILCQRATVILFDWVTSEWLIFADDANRPYSLGREIRTPIPPGWDDGFGTETTRILADLRLSDPQMPHYQPLIKDGLVSGIQALFVVQGQRIGLLGLNADTPGFFTTEHQEIATQIASQLAIAIHQMHLSEEMAHHSQIVEGLGNFLQTTLDAFPANMTVLDPDGKIIAVNRQWKHYSEDNAGLSATHYLGTNYLNVCDTSLGPMSEYAAPVAAGIRDVISGRQDEFELEYPCHSPTEERWFMLRVTPFEESVPRRVVAAHINITERKQAEKAEHEQRTMAETLRDSLAALTASLHVETIMEQILTYSAIVVPSAAGTIILYEGNMGRVAYSKGFSAEARTYFNENLIPLNKGVLGQTYLQQEGYLIGDTRTAADWVAFPSSVWVRSSIGVPIVLRGESIGILIADSATPNHFQQKDVQNLQAFARYVALALENAHHVDQLEGRVIERTAELQEAKERVEAILNNSMDGILLVHTDMSIQQMNSSFNNLFACDPNDFFGKSLITLIHTEDTERVTNLIGVAVREQRGQSVEIRTLRKNGTVFDAELSLGFIKDDGLVCTIRDITERKEQERHLRFNASIQKNLSDAVIATDLNFVIQSWNHAAETIYGWSADDAFGKTIDSLLQAQLGSNEGRQRLRQHFLEVGHWVGDVEHFRKDGSNISVRVSVTRLDDENNRPYGFTSVFRDITESKEQERQLRYHASLQENVSDAVIVTDMQFRIQSWNKAAERIYGLHAEEVIGKTIPEIMPTEFSSPEERVRSRQQLHEQGWWQGEVIQHHRDGSMRHILGSVTLVKDENGLPFSVVAVNHDITKHKQAEEEIRSINERLQLATEAGGIGIWDWDVVNNSMVWDAQMYRLYGIEDQHFTGTVEIWDRSLHPDDALRAQAELEVALRGKERFDTEFRIVTREGDLHHIRAEAKVYHDKHNTAYRMIGVNIDITKQKTVELALRESEEKFRMLIETMRGGLVIFDSDYRITYVNERFSELLGYSQEECLGKRQTDFVGAVNLPQVQAQIQRRQLLESTSYEIPLEHKDGRTVYMLMAGSPLIDKDGENDGSIVVATDITIQKQAEETLRQALAKEKELGELKSRFVSMASHEFRTPLATILALTETLMAYRHKLPEEQIEQRLVKIQDQVSQLTDIMDDVLLLARMQARRLEFNPVKLNLDDLCRSVIDEFQSRPDVTRRLEYRCDERLHEITLDKKLMRQIINNLVSNAVKYSTADSLITITLEFENDNLIFKVADQGIGIPEVDLKHLFDPFHRAGNVGAISGTGLGMVITKESVEMHNGTIMVESQVGVGTTFTVIIPLTK